MVVDYSSPNVVKEMHVGHLRTTVVGDAIVRILEHLGHTVVRANHVGDWGTQFGLLIEHLLDVGEEAARAALSAGEINAFYQAARAKFDADPAFAERSRHRVVTLQAGNPDTLRLWQLMVTDSRQYYNAIYQRLGVTLTDTDLAPESFYNPLLADVCAELEAAGIAVISDGALVAFPPGFTGRDGAPHPMILRKRDGGYGYDTTDLAAIRYRIKDLKATRLIYVVGAEQTLHFRMLFAVARQAGWLTDEVRAEHAVIGLVSGSGGGRIRTRTGESVKLITLIDEAVERAEEVIADRYDDPELRHQIADAVGIGALKYADLSVARDSGYTFDFDRMLALTGNTGPYLQYATARIRSIFRRAGLDPAAAAGPIRITEAAERALARGPARVRPVRAPGGADRRAAPAGRLPFRGGQRVHHVLRGVPGAEGGRTGGPRQQAGAMRPGPAGAGDRPGPARRSRAGADVAGATGRHQQARVHLS